MVEITDEAGKLLFLASLDQDSIKGDPIRGKFKFTDKDPKINGGVGKLVVSRHSVGYRMSGKLYGQFADPSASPAHLATHIFVQDTEWTVVGDWTQTAKGWVFKQK